MSTCRWTKNNVNTDYLSQWVRGNGLLVLGCSDKRGAVSPSTWRDPTGVCSVCSWRLSFVSFGKKMIEQAYWSWQGSLRALIVIDLHLKNPVEQPLLWKKYIPRNEERDIILQRKIYPCPAKIFICRRSFHGHSEIPVPKHGIKSRLHNSHANTVPPILYILLWIFSRWLLSITLLIAGHLKTQKAECGQEITAPSTLGEYLY